MLRIPFERQQTGMMVYVQDIQKTYRMIRLGEPSQISQVNMSAGWYNTFGREFQYITSIGTHWEEVNYWWKRITNESSWIQYILQTSSVQWPLWGGFLSPSCPCNTSSSNQCGSSFTSSYLITWWVCYDYINTAVGWSVWQYVYSYSDRYVFLSQNSPSVYLTWYNVWIGTSNPTDSLHIKIPSTKAWGILLESPWDFSSINFNVSGNYNSYLKNYKQWGVNTFEIWTTGWTYSFLTLRAPEVRIAADLLYQETWMFWTPTIRVGPQNGLINDISFFYGRVAIWNANYSNLLANTSWLAINPNTNLQLRSRGWINPTAIWFHRESQYTRRFYANTSGNFVFVSPTNETSPNVGIATTNPLWRLHVALNSGGTPDTAWYGGVYLFNPMNAAGQNANLTLRTAGTSAGSPYVSFAVVGETGWSAGMYNPDNSFRIAPNWADLNTTPALTIDNTTRNIVIGKTLSLSDRWVAWSQNLVIGDDTFFSDIDVLWSLWLYSTVGWWWSLRLGWIDADGRINLSCTSCWDNSSNWGNMTIQGRVISANNNIHLSPPNGSSVVINTTYRAAGWTAWGVAWLIVQWNVTAAGFFYSSDRTLKKNLQPLKSSLEKILSLTGYLFQWKSDNTKDIGIIAQDVETVFPELVQVNKETQKKTVKYGNLVAPLIEAIKELNDKLEQQQKEIELLRKQLNIK